MRRPLDPTAAPRMPGETVAQPCRGAAGRAAPHFVLQSLPRSGSIMLGWLLDQHPELRCFGEIFSTKAVHLSSRGFVAAPLETAARLAYFGAQASPRRWGFRAHVYHGLPAYDAERFTDFWAALHPPPRVVHLVRENLFERYMSHRVARLTEQWFVRAGSDACIQRVTLRLSAAEVAANCEEMERWQAIGAARFPEALTVRFEEMVRHLAPTVATILRHLGVDDTVALRPATVRLSQSARATVENYDELKRYFRGSRWERFFVE